MIRQDSILELLLRAGSSSAPRLCRSVSKDSGIESGGEVVLLQKQVQLLQDEVTRLRLRGEEPAAEKAEPGSKKLTNGEPGDVTRGKKVRNRSRKDEWSKAPTDGGLLWVHLGASSLEGSTHWLTVEKLRLWQETGDLHPCVAILTFNLQ